MTITQKLIKLKKKITDHGHNKYIATPEFNKLTAENFATRLAQANLITKTDFYFKWNKTFTCWKWVEKIKVI